MHFNIENVFACQQCEAVNKFIEGSKILSPPHVRHFATSLVTNTLPLLRMGSRDGGLEGTVTEIAIHAATVLLCGQNKVLEPLKNLAFSPANMAVRLECDYTSFYSKRLKNLSLKSPILYLGNC